MDELCLAVDLGTGGPKVALVDHEGRVVSRETRAVTTAYGPDGAATQDANQWWDVITASARRLTDNVGSVPVTSVAVTGQWASTVPVDADGRPTGPCITWQDTRGGRHVRARIGGHVAGYKAVDVARWIRRTGGAPSKSGGDPVGHILHLTLEVPAVADASRWFLEPVDYLTMRFSGEPSATHASMQGSWLTDVRTLGRLAYDEELVAAVGLPLEKLPPLRPIGSVIGPVRGTVAAELGLHPNAVVVTGIPDLQAAALGAGATTEHAAHLALSTTSWISCPVRVKKTDIGHSIATVPGLTNDSYLVVNNQDTGAGALAWVRSVLAGGGSPLSFDELTALAATATPGSGRVIFTPWLAGERSPVDDRSARGGFSNLSLATTPADLVRAVLEGVAMNSAWLLGYVDRFCGARLDPLRLVGGGAQSPLWCQITADVTGRRVVQVPDPLFAQLRGVAALARIATGHQTLAGLEHDQPEGRSFTPDPDAAAALAPLTVELPDIYATSKARFHRLNPRG